MDTGSIPPPPTIPPAGFNAVLVPAFFFGFTPFHSPTRYYKIRLHPSAFVIPAKAGIQCFQLDTGLCRCDEFLDVPLKKETPMVRKSYGMRGGVVGLIIVSAY